MSFQHTNDYLLGYKPTVFPAGAEVVAVRYAIDLTPSDLDLNDVGAVGILPAGCIPVGLTIDADDLDAHATPTLTMSIGLLNATQTDLQVSFASGVTVGQVAGAQAMASAAMMRLTPTPSDRLLGLKVTAAAATKQAGQIGMTLFYKAA